MAKMKMADLVDQRARQRAARESALDAMLTGSVAIPCAPCSAGVKTTPQAEAEEATPFPPFSKQVRKAVSGPSPPPPAPVRYARQWAGCVPDAKNWLFMAQDDVKSQTLVQVSTEGQDIVVREVELVEDQQTGRLQPSFGQVTKPTLILGSLTDIWHFNIGKYHWVTYVEDGGPGQPTRELAVLHFTHETGATPFVVQYNVLLLSGGKPTGGLPGNAKGTNDHFIVGPALGRQELAVAVEADPSKMGYTGLLFVHFDPWTGTAVRTSQVGCEQVERQAEDYGWNSYQRLDCANGGAGNGVSVVPVLTWDRWRFQVTGLKAVAHFLAPTTLDVNVDWSRFRRFSVDGKTLQALQGVGVYWEDVAGLVEMLEFNTSDPAALGIKQMVMPTAVKWRDYAILTWRGRPPEGPGDDGSIFRQIYTRKYGIDSSYTDIVDDVHTRYGGSPGDKGTGTRNRPHTMLYGEDVLITCYSSGGQATDGNPQCPDGPQGQGVGAYMIVEVLYE